MLPKLKLCVLLSTVLNSKALVNQGLDLHMQLRNTFGSKQRIHCVNSQPPLLWLQFVMLMCHYHNHMCKLSNWFMQAKVGALHVKLGATYLIALRASGRSSRMLFNTLLWMLQINANHVWKNTQALLTAILSGDIVSLWLLKLVKDIFCLSKTRLRNVLHMKLSES